MAIIFMCKCSHKGIHTEDDVTYSTISVPLQEVQSTERKYHFMFQLNHKNIMSLPLIEGTTLLFLVSLFHIVNHAMHLNPQMMNYFLILLLMATKNYTTIYANHVYVVDCK